MRIIVSRTDRIGDVVLTLPLCALLRSQRGASVVALGRAYTRPLLEASPHVDEVLDWDTVSDADPAAQRDFLRAARADAIVHVFPRPGIARAALAARIPLRIGTSHRWYHWLTCNVLERFSRKRSTLHEAQLNVRLARRLLGPTIPPLAALTPLTAIRPRVPLPQRVTTRLRDDRFRLVLHPGSSGSAREWPLAQWKALAESLDPARVQVLVTGSGAEGAALRDWIASLPPGVEDLTGQLDLTELIALLAGADGLIAASTGPLHLAAAVGIHALGLFAATPPIHPGRWAPLGPQAEVLVAPGADVSAIATAQVRERVEAWVGSAIA
ncbi:MAG TPA: glycosyltransferase family 9 protein [Gemmatimonadaceae bacterium]|nr:glycosyltransferase family 9 protein [Gemmatimonadaceae bacterium]